MRPPSAALLIVGNEILSGKVRDDNAHFLAQELFSLGWDLREITVVSDEVTSIVTTLNRLKQNHDHVFTSGGIGPTHDDMTLDAVAESTGRPLVVSPLLVKLLKKFYKAEELSPPQLRLAKIPEGGTLHYAEQALYPQLLVDNIYPLPGIPKLFRLKFRELKELFEHRPGRDRRCLKLVAMETDVAKLLTQTSERFSEVNIGSYPTEVDGVWNLEIVLESWNSEQLEHAVQTLLEHLPPCDESKSRVNCDPSKH